MVYTSLNLIDSRISINASDPGHNPGIYLDRELAELQLDLYYRAEGHLYDRGETYFDDFESVGYLGAKNPADDEKCWVVFEGRAPGVYFRLADYEYQVNGYIGNLYTDEVDERSKLEDLYNDHVKSEESRRKNFIVVYADGCCLRNGRPGARAGVGVYYGPNDSRNSGKPLDGAVQTNQRAELAAVRQALVDNPSQPMTICTDSQYAINCVTVWGAKSGRRTGTLTQGGNRSKTRTWCAVF
ncbi:ribonuclease H-like domain-containing protein [Myxozyma melibiosi]|uniref:ribonuclease H n=1 Tax=Myxozyma melibiosi TaxID=54550 RepID=A0ABR1F3I9_9ASCO